MLLLLTVFSVGMVNAEEVTTEEEIVRTYEEEIVINSEESEYTYEDWELLRDEVTEFYYEGWDNVNLLTITIFLDGVKYVDDGVSTNPNNFYKVFDTEQYEHYKKAISFSTKITIDNVEYIYQLEINKDGTGEFYKFDSEQQKFVEGELILRFDYSITGETQFPPLNGEDIESWIANALENHLGWLLVVLGVSAATLAGIIWGIIKVIFYLKGLQILTSKQNETNTELSNKVNSLVGSVSTLNKANKLGEYTASALNEIVEKSTRTDKERLRKEYLKALYDNETSQELKEEEVKKVHEIQAKEKEQKEKEKRSLDKIKENIAKG